MADTYIYVVVRQDLVAEQQAVQACHAAWQAGSETGVAGASPNLVLLHVPHEEALHRLAQTVEEKGIRYALFFEPDGDMGYSALTTEPLSCRKQRALFSKLPLFAFSVQP